MEHPKLPESPAPEMRVFAPGERVAVVVEGGLDRLLDYRAPEGGARPGDLVEVPLGPRRVLGAVWGAGDGRFDEGKLRDVARVLDAPPLKPAMREFLARAAEYTLTPLAVMLRLATRAPGLGAPPAARPIVRRSGAEPARMTGPRGRVLAAFAEFGNLGFAPGELAQLAGVSAGVVTGLEAEGVLVREAAPRDPPYPRLDPSAAPRPLSPAQAEAAARLRAAVRSRRYSTTLLKGVTGSGKTEVYLQAAAETLARGR
jgi:primosomal protein N' (replication factor Y)